MAESNRLAKVGEISYQYDANGNIINDGEHTYSYDARNRLTEVDNENYYLFNASNMRVKKITSESTTLYGWDNDRIFSEYDGSGNVIQETVYFGSTPIALLKDESIYRIFADQIDTPRVIADSLNNTLWTWESKPFGENKPNEDVDGNNVNLSYNLRFPGQYYDAETQKHYNFNRDYNPMIGRYVQSDPIGLMAGGNTYGYVDSGILTNSDSSGLMIEVYDTSLTQQHKRIIHYALQTVRAKASIPRAVNYFNLLRYDIKNNGRGHRVVFQNRRQYTNMTVTGKKTPALGLTSRYGTNIDVGIANNNAFLLAGVIAHEIGHYANKNYTTGWWIWKRQVNPSISSVIALTPSETPNPKDPIYGYAAEVALFGRIIVK